MTRRWRGSRTTFGRSGRRKRNVTRAKKGWTKSRIRCVAYAIKLVDETIAKVRADLTTTDSGNLDSLRDVDAFWNWSKSALIKAPQKLKAMRAESERTRERKRGPGPKVPKHWRRD